MNEIYVRIKQAQKQYRVAAIKEKNSRAKVKASILSTLLGDVDTKNKRGDDVEESDIVKLIKKYIKDIDASYVLNQCPDLAIEKEALTVFLPRQMSDNELTTAINGIVAGLENPTASDLGKIMGSLKRKHDGQFDGGKASKLAKEILSK